MPMDENIEKLLAPVFEALRTAARDIYATGHSDGAQAFINKVMESANALPSSPARTVDYAKPAAEVSLDRKPEGDEAETRRAPKGLIDTVLMTVLTEHPGMTQDEVEKAVVAADARIAVKSVYNKLRHWERQGRRFRRHNERWYRIQDIPAPWAGKSSPQWETGGVQPPVSINDPSKAGQPDDPRFGGT